MVKNPKLIWPEKVPQEVSLLQSFNHKKPYTIFFSEGNFFQIISNSRLVYTGKIKKHVCHFLWQSRLFVVGEVDFNTDWFDNGYNDVAAYEVKNFKISDQIKINYESKWFTDCSASGSDEIFWCFDTQDRHQCWLSCKFQ